MNQVYQYLGSRGENKEDRKSDEREMNKVYQGFFIYFLEDKNKI